jgi:ubiquinone/menaquinone biosynthesis C-methylase UbiE
MASQLLDVARKTTLKHLANIGNRACATYTHGHHKTVVSHHATRTAESVAGFLLPHLNKSQVMLDVGCGPGSITEGFGDRVAHVTGVDMSEDVLQQARLATFDKPNVKFVQGSAYELPFPDNSFDVVWSHQFLQHVSDARGALSEMFRVAKVGGLVAVREAICDTYQVVPQCHRFVQWRDLYKAIAYQNSAEPNAGLFLEHWMADCGAEVGSIKYQHTVMTYSNMNPEARQVYCESWSDRVLNSSFAKQALEYSLAQNYELDSISKSWAKTATDPHAVVLYVNGECMGKKSELAKFVS